MKAFERFLEVLGFAIEKEEEAIEFYTSLAARLDSHPQLRAAFLDFADEERGHKRRLESIRAGKRPIAADEQAPVDLKISDYVVDNDPGAGLDFQKALILAMKREKAAFRLYSDLASATSDATTKSIFLALAQEEARHKLRFEIEYDEAIQRDN